MVAESLLVRYGAIPQVSRFRGDVALALGRGTRAIVQTGRGLELGVVLEPTRPAASNGSDSPGAEEVQETLNWSVLRVASPEDESTFQKLRAECETEFSQWRARIESWNLNLELIDLEWTLDRGRLILYVLNERGPDCTKLALQAAAAGLGLIEVQPVDADGLVQLEASGGGCGSGGCGCGS